MNITRMISNYNFSYGNNIQFIVLHDTGNYTDFAKNNANYFQQNRQASAHYFIDDYNIYQVVEDINASWHCGDGGNRFGVNNHNSIGIEMCRKNNTVTEETEKNAIELVKNLMSKYSIDITHVVRHWDASRKNCPSSFSAENWERWINFKSKIQGKAINTPISNPTPIIKPISKIQEAKIFIENRALELQQKLNKVGGYNLTEDGDFGVNTYNAVINFQKNNGLEVDGLFGKNSWNTLNSKIIKPTINYNWVYRLQGAIGANQDGIAGAETLSKCPLIKYGSRGVIVILLQDKLKECGYNCGSSDGIAGANTENCIKLFQSNHRLVADGICGKNTWQLLLGFGV